jgi:hypothetical protein
MNSEFALNISVPGRSDRTTLCIKQASMVSRARICLVSMLSVPVPILYHIFSNQGITERNDCYDIFAPHTDDIQISGISAPTGVTVLYLFMRTRTIVQVMSPYKKSR